MHLFYIPAGVVLLVLNLQLCSSNPISSGLSGRDVDVLKLLLNRLEDSVPEQMETDRAGPAPAESLDALDQDGDERRDPAGLEEEVIRELLSARSLKSVRNESSRKSSGCFGRRMDRIGSMSSLGCNTVGKYNPK